MTEKTSNTTASELPTEKALNVLFLPEILTADGKYSKTQKSALVSFNNYRFRAVGPDGEEYEFFGQVTLYRNAEPVKPEPEKRKTLAAVIS